MTQHHNQGLHDSLVAVIAKMAKKLEDPEVQALVKELEEIAKKSIDPNTQLTPEKLIELGASPPSDNRGLWYQNDDEVFNAWISGADLTKHINALQVDIVNHISFK